MGGLPESPGPAQPFGHWPRTRPFGMPVGSIIAFAGKILQQEVSIGKFETNLQHFGWKVCDGDALKIVEYPDLFAAIGFIYSDAEGETYSLPDYSGYFLRSAVKKGGSDPAFKENRKADSGGETDGVGSTQELALQDHTHYYDQPNQMPLPASIFPPATLQIQKLPDQHTGYVTSDNEAKVSDLETRSINIAVYWLIKCLRDYWSPG